MPKCLEPTNCPDELTGIPCNTCWGLEVDRQQVTVSEADLAWANLL